MASSRTGSGNARFVGNFEHTLDDKGRLILPASFRPKLAEGAFVTPLDHCLAILPASEFDRMADALEEQVAAGEVDVNALRALSLIHISVLLGGPRVVVSCGHRFLRPPAYRRKA